MFARFRIDVKERKVLKPSPTFPGKTYAQGPRKNEERAQESRRCKLAPRRAEEEEEGHCMRTGPRIAPMLVGTPQSVGVRVGAGGGRAGD